MQQHHEGGGGEGEHNDSDFQWTIVSFAVIFVLISLFAIGCGIYMLCRKDNPDAGESGPGYSVAISNRLFKVRGISFCHSLNIIGNDYFLHVTAKN